MDTRNFAPVTARSSGTFDQPTPPVHTAKPPTPPVHTAKPPTPPVTFQPPTTLQTNFNTPTTPLDTFNQPSTSACTPKEATTTLDTSKQTMKQFIEGQKSLNTVRKTERDCFRFSKYIFDRHGDNTPIEELDANMLDIYLGEWLMSLCKPDGTNYEPDTLTAFHRSIDRYLREHSYEHSIITSKEFQMSKQVLQTKRKQLSAQGLGNHPHKSEVLTLTDEDILWTSGQLGFHNPQALFNTVWFLNTKLFGFRGGHENRQLKWGDISLHKDSDGDEYLQFRERLAKTRQGNSGSRAFAPKAFANKENPSRYPIESYKLYKAHRPSNYVDPESPFYVAVNNTWLPNTTYAWYKKAPMGQKTLSSVMKVMAEKAGLHDKKLSNHSVRRTMCTTLLQEGVAPNIIAQLSGHKNLGSLQHYSVASTAQQKQMSNILQGMKTPQTPQVAPSQTPKQSTPAATISTPPDEKSPATLIEPPTVSFPQSTPPNPMQQFLSLANLQGSTININMYYASETTKK